MLIRATERAATEREKPCDGEGRIYGLNSIGGQMAVDNTRISMAAQMTLPPDCSVGLHRHEDDEELYYIVSGHGSYIRNNGEREDIGPGDVTLTRKGERHSIIADKNEPIVFFAVIIR